MFKKNEKERPPPCPEDTANVFSRLTFWWLSGLLKIGRQRPLEHTDLWGISPEHQTRTNGKRLMRNWNIEATRKKPSLLRALWNTFGVEFILAGLWKIPQDLLLFAGPWLLNQVVSFVSNQDLPSYQGYLYAVLMFLLPCCQTVFLHGYFGRAYKVSIHIDAAVKSAVYHKSLKLSSSARQKSTVGEICNLMSVDAGRIADPVVYLHNMWSAPLQISISLYYLYQLVGVSTFAGVAAMIAIMPLNSVSSWLFGRAQEKLMKHKDSRVKLMNQILQGIRILKFFGWETSFEERVLGIRKMEYEQLRKCQLLDAVGSLMWEWAPTLVSIVTFASFTLSGGELTSARVFTALAVFNILRFPLQVLPWLIASSINANVSLKRLSQFLLNEEIQTSAISRKGSAAQPRSLASAPSTSDDLELGAAEFTHSGVQSSHSQATDQQSFWSKVFGSRTSYGELEDEQGASVEMVPNDSCESEALDDETAIEIANATFRWSKDESVAPTLQNVSLKIKKGQLVSVVGEVGSGKSSLLSALFGDIERSEGSVRTNGKVAYCAQQPWIVNASVRDNITFCNEFDQARYDRAVHSCALDKDFASLPAGDMTEIGENGINLSGGQKARVSLARAVYHGADIYLLDSPLSAVDAHVGKHLFFECVAGALSGATRILVTHSLQFLAHSDLIVVLKDGRVSECGTYQDLMAKQGSSFASLIQTHVGDHKDDEDEESGDDESGEEGESKDGKEKEHKDTKKKSAADSEVKSASGQLTQAEERKVGSVQKNVYKEYFLSYGLKYLTLIITMGAICQLSKVASDVWLSLWSDSWIQPDPGVKFYLALYCIISFSSGFLTMFRQISLALGGLLSSTALHNRMLHATLRAPVAFFDKTPVGRIINKFSKDQNTLDQELIETFSSFIVCLLLVLSTILVIGYVTPPVLALMLPLAVVYYKVQQYYRCTSREVKRLEQVSRSPIFSNFSATLTGVSTIRAYGLQTEFSQDNECRIDSYLRAYYPSIMLNRWLGERLEFIGNGVVFFAALFAVVSRDKLDPAFVGLSLSYGLSITGNLNWLVRMMVSAESQLTSVERILDLAETPQEPPLIRPENRPPDNWPTQGQITLMNAKMRYREDLEPAIKGLNVEIKPREKIGIVGRTGSGKSSLTMCLFRIVELMEGSILIDGVNISNIGLHDLRQRLAIIPQDPFIFAVSVRSNLDPFDEFTDHDIWTALERVSMKAAISALPDKLEHVVAENGENFSVGQRQLLCLARALLRKSVIICLDEATANVDVESDMLIQRTVREHFKDCTVVTIAHRLNTIIDSDRILVLDQGKVAEFDTPSNLLSNPESFFTGLVKQTGEASSKHLSKIAAGEIDIFSSRSPANE